MHRMLRQNELGANFVIQVMFKPRAVYKCTSNTYVYVATCKHLERFELRRYNTQRKYLTLQILLPNNFLGMMYRKFILKDVWASLSSTTTIPRLGWIRFHKKRDREHG